MNKPLTPDEIRAQHDNAISALSVKKDRPVFDDPFDKDRPRGGARWLDDEMDDLKEMVTLQYSLETVAGILRRSKPATLKRIMTHKLSVKALAYMPEAKRYMDEVKRFSGRCYYRKKK